MEYRVFARSLAASFLGGEQTADRAAERATRTLGRPWKWLQPLAERYVEAFTGATRPTHYDVISFLEHDGEFQRVWRKYRRKISIEHWVPEPSRMLPVAAAAHWDLPIIESAGALADWLWLEPRQLEWFADLKRLGDKRHCPRLANYFYRVILKRNGHIRVIEAPKRRLKRIQRQILEWILDKVPPHPAAHGFVAGRSIQSFVAPHIGKRVVLRMDLQDFFPSLIGARIDATFRTFGYPESVASLLGGMCTNVMPRDGWNQYADGIDATRLWEARSLYFRRHLPQGAPTSPALA